MSPYQQAFQSLDRGDWQTAISTADSLLQKKPNNADYLFLYAHCQLQKTGLVAENIPC